VNFVQEPWLGDEQLSHTTDLVREDRAATRRAREFSSINGKIDVLLRWHWQAACASCQEDCLC
jgi:hypothetical protein